MTEVLPIASIRRDGGTQTRAQIDMLTAQEYAAAIKDGAELPPVTVFYDGSDYWLAGGFHRVQAHELLGFVEIVAEIRQGTRQDAVWAALAENLTHGRRRTTEDKRRAVEVALKEFPQKSDSALAQQCGVDHKTVAAQRSQLEATWEIPKSIDRTGSDGRTINTANIGRKAEPDTLRTFDDAEPVQRSWQPGAGDAYRPDAGVHSLAQGADAFEPEPAVSDEQVIDWIIQNDPDGRVARSQLRSQYSSHVSALYPLYQLQPDALVKVLRPDELDRLRDLGARAAAWHAEIEACRTQGLRLVGDR